MRRAPEVERRIGKPPEQPLWQCGDCRHIQVHPTPSPERIASYYLPGTDATKRGRATWAGGAVHVTPSYLRRLRRVAAKRSGTLLDVGFGPGTFLRAAHAIGYRVSGVDLDTTRFKPDFDCELREGTLCAGLFPDRSFDVVAAHHVLEHVEDLTRTLRVIHDLLRPGGYLIIELPHDLNSLIKGLRRALFKRGYTKFTRLQHLRFFTVRSLRATLERSGFEVELCRSIPSYRSLRLPTSLLLTPVAPLERLTGCGHNLEAIARKA
jgi:SAM-dependent methyltransferase